MHINKKLIKKIKKLAQSKDLDIILTKDELKETVDNINYKKELEKLQIELIKLQKDVVKNKRKVCILIEGRDAAGKGGAIKRFMEHLNPRHARVVALGKPNQQQLGQMYFQRYINHLPNEGEIVFFDRSWYNRAVVEPVMGFCTIKEHNVFYKHVNNFEELLKDSGIELIKFWFSVSKNEQKKRFENRKSNLLKQWKISPVDEKAQKKWNEYTKYKNKMFKKTNTQKNPWIIVDSNNKWKARLESIKYIINKLLNKKQKFNPKIIKRA